jgi:hypothetical protein
MELIWKKKYQVIFFQDYYREIAVFFVLEGLY